MKRIHIGRLVFAALMSFSTLFTQTVVPAAAGSERALYLYHTHNQTTARIVFKRNGQYLQSGLNELNRFLADWRTKEPTKMDPALFDLVWEVYQEVGASQPVHIVSAYRTPATNAMLRSRSSAVAENSQHTKGRAMDFFIPGISLTKLRATAMRQQVGGVGFYPTSGSPFVHLDTGNVRAWPRMTRAQLAQVFPDGKTLHLPTDGKPLSASGRQYAMAEWQRCHTVPCNGGSNTQIASADTGGSGTSLVDLLFGNSDNDQGSTTTQIASVAQPPLPRSAPTPMMRPAALGGATQIASIEPVQLVPFSSVGSAPSDEEGLASTRIAPIPAIKSPALLMATATALPTNPEPETALTALAAIGAPVPASRVLMTNSPAVMMTAYAPEPGAQRALELIIQRSTTAALPPLPGEQPSTRTGLVGVSALRTASLGGDNELQALAGLFDMTWGAVESHGTSAKVAAALAEREANPTRDVEFIAPDLEHVADVFLTPVLMTSAHFAEFYDHDEADLSPATELGPYVTHMGIGDLPPEFSHDQFVAIKPLALASR